MLSNRRVAIQRCVARFFSAGLLYGKLTSATLNLSLAIKRIAKELMQK
jgi:hypothetical protein